MSNLRQRIHAQEPGNLELYPQPMIRSALKEAGFDAHDIPNCVRNVRIWLNGNNTNRPYEVNICTPSTHVSVRRHILAAEELYIP